MPSKCTFMPMRRHLWSCCVQSIPTICSPHLSIWHTKLTKLNMTDVVVNCIRELCSIGNELYKDYHSMQRHVLWVGLRPSLTPFFVTNYRLFKSPQRNRNKIMNHWNTVSEYPSGVTIRVYDGPSRHSSNSPTRTICANDWGLHR